MVMLFLIQIVLYLNYMNRIGVIANKFNEKVIKIFNKFVNFKFFYWVMNLFIMRNENRFGDLQGRVG